MSPPPRCVNFGPAHCLNGLFCAQGLAGQVASRRTVINIQDDAEDEALRSKTTLGIRSVLAVPILYNGDLLGVAQVINKIDEYGEVVGFTPSDETLVDYFSMFSAICLNNAKLYDFACESSKGAHELLSFSAGKPVVISDTILCMSAQHQQEMIQAVHKEELTEQEMEEVPPSRPARVPVVRGGESSSGLLICHMHVQAPVGAGTISLTCATRICR